MAVPAHDARDFEFAKTFDLPMRLVVSPNDGKEWDQEKAYSGDGTLVNSSYEIDINGLSTSEAATKVIQWLEQSGSGKKQVRGLTRLYESTISPFFLVGKKLTYWDTGQLQASGLAICQTTILGRTVPVAFA